MIFLQIKRNEPKAFPFFALFSLRQPANLFTGIIGYLITGKFSNANDEAKIDFLLALPSFTSSLITSVLSLCIFAFIFFKIIPKPVRITFAAAGMVGGVLGFYWWFHFFDQLKTNCY